MIWACAWATSSGWSPAQGREAQLNVAGIFELGVRELDQRYVYLDLKQTQSLLDLPGGVTVIDVTVQRHLRRRGGRRAHRRAHRTEGRELDARPMRS